jgi:hypothetical protein
MSLRAHEADAEGVDLEYSPPTEAEFAAAVARDVVREMLPPPETMFLVILAAVWGFLIGLWLGGRDKD